MHSFETLVIGSGPAGIAAAVSAAENGVRVGLVDDNAATGGQVWREDSTKPTASHPGLSSLWRQRLMKSQVTLLQGWRVFDQIAPGIVRAERQDKSIDLRFNHLVLSTGARELFLPFPGWTLPNVMGLGALQAMVKCGLPIRGKRVVLAGSGPLMLAVAAYLKAAGAIVICMCEQAPASQLLPFALSLASTPGKILEGLRYRAATREIPFHSSAWPLAATGDGQLRSVTLSIHGRSTQVDCDYLACAFHLVPNTELPSLLGCDLKAGSVAVDDWQRTSVDNIYCAGEPTGIGGLELSVIEGQIAGFSIANQKEKAKRLFPQRARYRRFATRLAEAFALRPELKGLPTEETLLCRCEDVPYGAVKLHPSWRSAKLQTRCGMGPCQGRVCGAATEFLMGWNDTSVRPPVFPAQISHLVTSPTENDATTLTMNQR
jgi:NADPH-dependent 2,4-dienoyl-CoA reductase/sulfur reductase-like enzyme